MDPVGSNCSESSLANSSVSSVVTSDDTKDGEQTREAVHVGTSIVPSADKSVTTTKPQVQVVGGSSGQSLVAESKDSVTSSTPTELTSSVDSLSSSVSNTTNVSCSNVVTGNTNMTGTKTQSIGDMKSVTQFIEEIKSVNDLINCSTDSTPKTAPSGSVCNHNGGANIGGANHLAQPAAIFGYRSSNNTQRIILEGNDRANTFSVKSKEVEVITSRLSSNPENQAGSNKVKTTTVVKFEWEARKYLGNLVAVHRNGVFVAYCLRGKSGANVRILNRKTADRTLLKDFCGRVTDLAFAFTDKILLAAIDEMGNLYIHQITGASEGKIQSKLLLNIVSYNDNQSEFHRVFWCPYIPDESEDDTSQDNSFSKMLLITHGEKAEIWNVDMVCQKYGTDSVISNEVTCGVLRINSHTKPIADAAFSPDGSALATASMDGMVKFFQITMNEGPSPSNSCNFRRLHEWSPHGGQPLSCLFFLDDHQNPHPDVSFWKYAVTGGNYNQELKVWSCVSWTCLQTIRFLDPPSHLETKTELCMKVALDLSARYLVLTDFRRKVLYILNLHQDHKAETVYISSISEFLLARPCLSFAILDARSEKFRQSLEDDTFLEELTTGEIEQDNSKKLFEDEDSTIVDGVLVELYAVHSTILQELNIRFKTEVAQSDSEVQAVGSKSQDEIVLKDGLSDVSNIMDTSVPDSSESSRGEKAPVLLTPDAFTSKPYSLQTISANSSFTQVSAMEDSTECHPLATGVGRNGNSDAVATAAVSVTACNNTVSHTSSPNSSLVSSQSPLKNKDTNMPSVSTISPVVSIDSSHSPVVTNLPLQNIFSEPTKISVEELFKMSQQVSQAAVVVSGSITSSVSLEGEQAFRKTRRKDFDETDKEVAEVMGDKHVADEVDEVSPLEIETSNIATESNVTAKISPREWPKPPDVSTDGPRIASEKVCNVREGQDIDDDEEEDEDYSLLVDASSNSKAKQPKPLARQMQLTSEPAAPPIHEAPVQIIREVVEPQSLKDIQAMLSTINNKLTRFELLSQQMQELFIQQQQQLKQQAALQQMAKVAVTLPVLEQHLKSMENRMTGHFERLMHQQSQREHQRYQEILNETQSYDKKHEALVNTLWQAVDTTLRKNLEMMVKSEMKNNVLPTMMQSLESIKMDLTREVAQKLSASDAILKENLAKLVRNRQTIEAIGSSVGAAIEVPIQTAYRESFQNIVIPNFERTSQNMYNQVHDTFQKGTKEYLVQLQQHLEVGRRRQMEVWDPVVSQLQSTVEMFKGSTEHLHTHLLSVLEKKLETVVTQSLKGLKDTLLQHVREVVKDEVNKAMRLQGNTISDNVLSAMRSGAVTPVPGTQDVHILQNQILRLLNQGQINAAFQQALSAANLELVILTCEKANPDQVFGQIPFPLQQPVLLSLIQQLSADIETHTLLKQKYLEEAIVSLDTTNPITHEHKRSVLSGLIPKLNNFIQSHPNSPDRRSISKLLMLAQAHFN
ncbi:enhancer of mRNA-decapping protein 4 isoform X2 [Octopus bimaculoides]|uniref:enhancer of mRNA-decapping protein 4 isoform X2 n=1 Tax=Octopus bimaculoides TaxID=37653 RepID=UPI00071DE61C|nr:enhancer of mRNA-decapping protein 4 isoform X2 [Octopus bimaculoides]|eukprot:XP_014769268.1 PREDICTED: enhancer of mRNA-decapping protein 4-like isoform X2 [Octopus bimaculoides]